MKITKKKLCIKKIDNLLPQKQCKKCGYIDCLSYANIIYQNKNNENICVHSGKTIVKSIKYMTKKPISILEKEKIAFNYTNVALINEINCIGCKICIKKCPVKAIVGGIKKLHTIIEDVCTGCKICIESCPVNCIKNIHIENSWNNKQSTKSKINYQKSELANLSKKLKKNLLRINIKNNLNRRIFINDILLKARFLRRFKNKKLELKQH